MSESKKDEQKQERELYEAKKNALFQAIRSMNSNTSQSALLRARTPSFSYTVEQVDTFMKRPKAFQKELRILSNSLYDYSPEYRQIIDYMSTLPKYAYVLDPLFITQEESDWKAIEKAKLKVSQEVDKFSLPHELAKVMRVMWKEDTFYGYEHETKNSFTIQNMNADYCRLSNLDYDGLLLYEFDFSYFDSFPELLSSHPEEFHKKYQQYQNTGERWIELDPDRAVAFKVNEEILSYSLLPYGVLFEPLFDLEEYKKLQKARAKMDNFMLLTQHIPLNDKKQSMDEFLISLETAMEFHNNAIEGLGDGIGLITSPMKIESIKTEKSNSDKDSIAMALRSVYDAGGISQFLFNSDKATSTGVSKSLIVDEQKVFKIYRQMERWLNRKLRKLSGRYKFKLRLLDITNFDEDKSFDTYLKAAQSGFPFIEEAAATVGIEPLDLHNKLMVESSPMGYQYRMKPLSTSYTQSSKDEESGRPSVSEDEAAESTITWRDSDDGQGEA